MVTLRRIIVSAPAVLAGTAFLAFAAGQAQQAQQAPQGQQTPAQPAAKGQQPPAKKEGPRPPAWSLSKPLTPEKAPALDGGFIQRWLLLEPISTNGQLTDSATRAAITKEYFPNQMTVIPKDGDKVTYNNTELKWHAIDTKLYNVNLYHFAWALTKPTTNVLFWAVTQINCPKDMPNVRLAIGSNAASVWWVNGEEVASLYNDRQTVIDDAVSKRITLKKGLNVLRAAIINAGGATDFCARFLDENDKPLRGYTITLNETAKKMISSR